MADKHRFFVTCARGTEGALRREIAAMRIAGAKGDKGGVWFEGPLRMGMQVCLHARVAVRVLLELAAFDISGPDDLYAGARTVDWRAWLTATSTLAVRANIGPDAPGLNHSGFAALKVKDAVVDTLRDALGVRPDVDPKDPDVSITLHVAGRRASLFLDLAGEALHRRGYRVAMTDAPLKETLAAAVLVLGGVPADVAHLQPFVDPMAGSGTLAIEHALAARGIAPGLRRRFGFERWPALDSEALAAWQRMRQEAEDVAARPRAPLPPIVCADSSSQALGAARQNASAAMVDEDLTFEVADVSALDRRWPTGTVCTNPPYGERLTAGPGPREVEPRSPRLARSPHAQAAPRPPDAALAALYRDMGRAFLRLRGWTVVVLSGNPLFSTALPGKPAISHRLYNGPLEVRLLRYEIPA
jgi:23S rRNA G2445 N2-methylase RlmL